MPPPIQDAPKRRNPSTAAGEVRARTARANRLLIPLRAHGWRPRSQSRAGQPEGGSQADIASWSIKPLGHDGFIHVPPEQRTKLLLVLLPSPAQAPITRGPHGAIAWPHVRGTEDAIHSRRRSSGLRRGQAGGGRAIGRCETGSRCGEGRENAESSVLRDIPRGTASCTEGRDGPAWCLCEPSLASRALWGPSSPLLIDNTSAVFWSGIRRYGVVAFLPPFFWLYEVAIKVLPQIAVPPCAVAGRRICCC
jgi:hypothetical protein